MYTHTRTYTHTCTHMCTCAHTCTHTLMQAHRYPDVTSEQWVQQFPPPCPASSWFSVGRRKVAHAPLQSSLQCRGNTLPSFISMKIGPWSPRRVPKGPPGLPRRYPHLHDYRHSIHNSSRITSPSTNEQVVKVGCVHNGTLFCCTEKQVFRKWIKT